MLQIKVLQNDSLRSLRGADATYVTSLTSTFYFHSILLVGIGVSTEHLSLCFKHNNQ